MSRTADELNDDAITNDGQNGGIPDNAGNDGGAADDQNAAPVGAAPTPTPEFALMTDRERALVEKARAEEKRKLYKKAQDQDNELKTLRAQVKELQRNPLPSSANESQRQSRDEKLDQLLAAMNRLAEQQDTTNARLETIESAEQRRQDQLSLDRLRNALVAEIRANGEDVVEGMVGGETQEELEESIKIARAEWLLTMQRAGKKVGNGNGNGTPRSVTVQRNTGRPAGTPPVVAANSVEADNHENIDDLTSDAAVRNGDYEKNRNSLFSRLRRGYKYGQQPTS